MITQVFTSLFWRQKAFKCKGSVLFVLNTCIVLWVWKQKLPLSTLCPGSCAWWGYRQPASSHCPRLKNPLSSRRGVIGAEPQINLEMFCHGAGYHHIRLLLPKMNKHCMKEKNRFSFTGLIVSFSKSPLKVGCWSLFWEVETWLGAHIPDQLSKDVREFLLFPVLWNHELLCAEPPRFEHTQLKQLWPPYFFPLACSVFGEESGVSWFPYLGNSTLAIIYLRLWQRKAEAFNLRSSQEGFKGNILSLAVCQVQGSLCITVGVGQIYSTNPEGLPEASRLAGLLFVFLWMFHSPARFSVSPSHLHIQKQISLPKMTVPEKCRATDMHLSVLTDTKCPPGPQESCGEGLSCILEYGSSVLRSTQVWLWWEWNPLEMGWEQDTVIRRSLSHPASASGEVIISKYISEIEISGKSSSLFALLAFSWVHFPWTCRWYPLTVPSPCSEKSKLLK